MSSWFRFTALFLVLTVLLLSSLFLTGYGQSVVLSLTSSLLGPSEPFDPSNSTAKPDYGDSANWAALPSKRDPADLIPDDVSDGDIQGNAPVDVFFIHPTGYHSTSDWVSPMDPESGTEENTLWMLANQASAFNGCCNVYAPRYREATIFTYMVTSDEEREEILDFVYQDVAAAFDYYLTRYNQGRPFIIAGHSQGTHHGFKLLQREIAGTRLANQMVAAYLIGSVHTPIESILASMPDIGACRGPLDLGCVIHWDTYGDGGSEMSSEVPGLCTNPLSWRTDSQRVSATMHLGAVPVAGVYNASYSSDDIKAAQSFDHLKSPLPKHTWAECRGNGLYVANQNETIFENVATDSGSKSYHGLDYSLFHMNIRENAKARVDHYLTQFR